MQLVPMCKMIVLIILPVPLNKKWTETLDSTPWNRNNNLHILMLPTDWEWTVTPGIWDLPFFKVGTSGKPMAF